MDLQFPEVAPRFGEDPKTGSEPQWDSRYEASACAWCNAAYDEADFDRKNSEELKNIGSYVDYIEGRQWKGNRPSYKSKPINNKVQDNFWELVGLLTDIKPIMDVKSTNTEKPYQDAAPVINKGIKSWALNNDYDQTLALNIAYSILTTSFQKWQWNPDLSMGQGDIEALPLGPRDVLPLKPKNNLPSSLAIIREENVNLGWLKRRYPTRGHLVSPDQEGSSYTVQPEAPAHVPSMLWDMMNEGMRRTIGGKPQTKSSAFPMARYREFWFRDYSTNTANVPVWMGKYNWRYKVDPGKPLYPRGRLICRAGQVVMFDGPNPYWHGLYPFTMLRLNIVPWQFYGMSDVKSWISLQDILNQVLAGIIDMIKRNVNPGFFAPKNAFSESVWANLDFSKPGERAAYSQAATHEPKFAPAPQMPGYVMTVYQMIERTLDQLSGKAMANQLAGKKQVPGSDTIESMQMMRTTPVRLKARNIETFMRDGGTQLVPLMVQFYTEKRRMTMLGPDGRVASDFDWDPGTMVPAGKPPEEFIKSFRFFVQPGSLLNTEKRQKIQDAMLLRRGGDLSRKTLFRIIDEGGLNAETEEKEIMRERQQGMPGLPAKGKGGK